MDNRIKQYARTLKGNKSKNEKSLTLIRYADDFVILHEDLEVIKQCQKIIQEWLSQYDLKLKPEKTKICHTLKKLEDIEPGFNFLGFNIRQYPVGKHQSGKNTKGVPLGFKLLIKPSKESIKNHYDSIAETCRRYNAAPQDALICKLNSIIRGWTNYYKTVVSKESFSKLNHLTFLRLLQWAKRRHPKKPISWIVNKYWSTVGLDNWVFGDKKGNILLNHPKTKIQRHIKVKDIKSPYDGDTLYWATRKGKHPELKSSTARLLKLQKGKCNWCKLTFQDGDIIETDHITPIAMGENQKDNLQLLHKHCHDNKTRYDLIAIKKHKVKKEWEKTLKKFNKMNWIWVEDIPTLI